MVITTLVAWIHITGYSIQGWVWYRLYSELHGIAYSHTRLQVFQSTTYSLYSSNCYKISNRRAQYSFSYMWSVEVGNNRCPNNLLGGLILWMISQQTQIAISWVYTNTPIPWRVKLSHLIYRILFIIFLEY